VVGEASKEEGGAQRAGFGALTSLTSTSSTLHFFDAAPNGSCYMRAILGALNYLQPPYRNFFSSVYRPESLGTITPPFTRHEECDKLQPSKIGSCQEQLKDLGPTVLVPRACYVCFLSCLSSCIMHWASNLNQAFGGNDSLPSLFANTRKRFRVSARVKARSKNEVRFLMRWCLTRLRLIRTMSARHVNPFIYTLKASLSTKALTQ
jgi:hypothetical protein